MIEAINKRIDELKTKMPEMKLPPNIFLDMDGEFVEYIEGESLTARFPFKERYENPFGYMQGGIIVAAIDNTVSPLSYLVSPPNVTTHINTTYIRPVKNTEKFIEVIASVVEKTANGIHFMAKVKSERGKLLATSTVSCSVIRSRQIK